MASKCDAACRKWKWDSRHVCQTVTHLPDVPHTYRPPPNPERFATIHPSARPGTVRDHSPTRATRNGLQSFSPGLAAEAYPGSSSPRVPNPDGVESKTLRTRNGSRPFIPPATRNGLQSFSPGLAAEAYPGSSSPRVPYPEGVESKTLARLAHLISSPNKGVPPMRHSVKLYHEGRGLIQPRWGWGCFWTWLPMVGLGGQPWAE
jgi:hypothetical protein